MIKDVGSKQFVNKNFLLHIYETVRISVPFV